MDSQTKRIYTQRILTNVSVSKPSSRRSSKELKKPKRADPVRAHIAHYSKSPTAKTSPLPQLRKSPRVEWVPDLDFDFVLLLHQQRVVLAPDPRLAARKRGH